MSKGFKKILSLLLVFVMLFGMFPTSAFAAGTENVDERTLELNVEQMFELEDSEDQVRFRYIAKEAGTYIFYFRDLTSNPISISWNQPNIEYYHDPANGHFEGRVVELEKDEDFTVCFGVSEGYDPYGAVVGVTTISKEFKDFYTNTPIDYKNRLFDVGIGQRTAQVEFFTEDRFCYGVEWSAVSENPEIVSINEEESIRTGVSYRPFFDLNNVGETTVTIRAEFAGATVEKTYFVKVREGGDEGGHPEDSYFKPFKNLEELKTLIKEHNGEEQAFFYEGEGALVIDESLDFPEDTRLETNDSSIVIDSGATVELDRLYCRELEVRGKLTARKGLHVDKNLEVSGQVLVLDNFLDMEYPASISGLENVRFREAYQKVVMNVRYESGEQLPELVDDVAENGYKDKKIQHIYRFEKRDIDNEETDVVLAQDITIAKNDRLELFDFKSFTIAQGTTLTVEEESSVGVSVPVTVNGVLVNNGNIDVSYHENGKLILTEDKAYSGTGELHVHCFDPNDFDKCFVPKTKDDFDATYDVSEEDGCYHYNVRYVAGLIKLGTPYDLTWGTQWFEEMEYDEVNDQLIITGYSAIPKAGFTSWKTKRPDQARAQVKIYRKGEKAPCYECWYGFGEEVIPELRSVDLFLESDLGSGTYYFTVQSMGDYITYRNSDIAVSGYYTYTQPSQKLTACSDLRWFDKNDNFASWVTWDGAVPENYVDGYQVQFFYSETENGNYEQYGGIGGRNGNPMFPEEPFHDHFLQEKGEGYYKFKVRALSSDITKYRNGEWSELSPVLDMKKIPQDITNDLDNLLNQNLPAQDVIDQVQSMDTVDLKKTLLTDQENNGATEVLRQLENQVGGPANVVVTKDAAAFNSNQVSIVGANLNNKDDESEAITLEIDKPEKQHVIDELYDSSVAVRFSMTLANVEDPKNLDVPVKITLPVPESINPDFLVILHYHVDGSHEIIYPFIHEMNGAMYADFVLTSFSDFVLTERIVPEIPTEDVSEVFTDVKDGAWYEESVQFVYDNGLMSGNDGLFNPTADITRAQLVTTLYRLAGSPMVTNRDAMDEFSDVLENKYYTEALCWAYAEDIANGNDGKFDPSGKLTRQQMAAFFFRFAQYAEMDVEVRGDISGMLNADKVSGYAKESVEWAVGAGLISGSEITVDGNKIKDLNPKGNTTRAQVATILMRFCGE